MYESLQAWTWTMAEVAMLKRKDGLKNKERQKLGNTEKYYTGIKLKPGAGCSLVEINSHAS